MSGKYRIDPNFIVPEPTAARFFFTLTEEDYAKHEYRSILDQWREEGVKQVRVTIVNDEYPNDPYPHGVYFEGWADPKARMLPFGEAEEPGGPCYPPLVAIP